MMKYIFIKVRIAINRIDEWTIEWKKTSLQGLLSLKEKKSICVWQVTLLF